MKNINTIISSAAAGMCIAIGGTVFLSLESRLAGALLFTVGLYIICTQGLNLYTGKVGYLALKPSNEIGKYILFLVEVWLGNFAGTFVTAVGLSGTRVYSVICEKASALCTVKLNDSLLSLFVLGILCGVLMYCAVDGYIKCQNPIILFVCVSGFILCGFEHCIADMYYFAVAGMISFRAVMLLLVITLGNSAGGMIVPLVTGKNT